MRKPLLLVSVLVLGVAAWRMLRASGAASEGVADSPLGIMDEAIMTVATVTGTWRPGSPYAEWVAQAEQDYGLPVDLLARVLYIESRYRPDIIDGSIRSQAGAVGIAQFMPATANWLGVNPLDPQQAIEGAARYLAQLYLRFGQWDLAVAAYNWGPGNLAKKGMGAAPAETVAYVQNVMGAIS